MIPIGGTTSCPGDVLAIVVAETREQARAAAELVDVGYTVHTPNTDPVAALAPHSPLSVWGTESNTLSVSAYQRGGDVDELLDASAFTVRETFVTQRIEHAFLEPESTLAVPAGDADERTMHVYSGGQGVWDDRDDIAGMLAVDTSRVTVELVSNGGAFGGKEDMSNQAHASLAAWLLGRPVKCTLSREESFRIHAKRHPITLEYAAGCDAEGRLTALKVRAIGDSGAYASVGMKVLERAAGHACGPYRWDALDIEATAVRTNNLVCGAFRGFGANQAQFAMEGVLDRLAEQVGISGWEIRKRNVIRPGDEWGPGQIMDDGAGGAEAVLDEIKGAYDEARAAGKAIGLGLGLKNSGLGNGFREVCGAVIRFRSNDGRVEVRHGFTEMGQGVHTVALQVAAEELGIDPNRIDVIVDTTRQLGFGQTTGSRGTLMTAGSVQLACRAAIAADCAPDVDHTAEYVIDWTQKLGDPNVTNPTIHSCFSFAAQLAIADRETGAIEKVIAVHDVGRAVNPMLVEGQVEGSVHMGLGYALTEDFPTDPETGFPTNMTLRSLGILRAKDVPEIEVRIVEVPQPRSPYGIKGVGEIGLVPTAPAVAAALREATGVWHTKLPMQPRLTVLGSDEGRERGQRCCEIELLWVERHQGPFGSENQERAARLRASHRRHLVGFDHGGVERHRPGPVRCRRHRVDDLEAIATRPALCSPARSPRDWPRRPCRHRRCPRRPPWFASTQLSTPATPPVRRSCGDRWLSHAWRTSLGKNAVSSSPRRNRCRRHDHGVTEDVEFGERHAPESTSAGLTDELLGPPPVAGGWVDADRAASPCHVDFTDLIGQIEQPMSRRGVVESDLAVPSLASDRRVELTGRRCIGEALLDQSFHPRSSALQLTSER